MNFSWRTQIKSSNNSFFIFEFSPRVLLLKNKSINTLRDFFIRNKIKYFKKTSNIEKT